MRVSDTRNLAMVHEAKLLMERGYSFTKACKLSGLSVGLAYYHLKRLGVPIRKRDPKLNKRDSRILNAHLEPLANYYLDSCSLHILPLRHGHDYRSLPI